MVALRPLVAASWQRSSAAGVHADDEQAPLVLPADTLQDYRTAHPLWRAMPVLQDVLGQAVDDCDALLAVADEHGQLLFVHGSTTARARAERIGFTEGSSWDERVVGTNAPGTSLTLGEPVVVRQGEHFRESVHQWSCVAVPIRDPRSGGVIGAVDVTGGDHIVVPQTMAMLRAAARLAEMELLRIAAPTGPGTARGLRVSALGVDCAAVTAGERTAPLSPRHSEILTLLAEAPGGLTGDEIACGLYEHESGRSTVRAEMQRLRAVLGDDVLASRPYRLQTEVHGDWSRVLDLVERGQVAAALQAYVGPLLPHSLAPAVATLRERIHAEVAAAVHASGRPDLLATWTRHPWGVDDHAAWTALARLTGPTSPLCSVALAHLERLARA